MTQNELKINITKVLGKNSDLKLPLLKGLVYCAYLTYGSTTANNLISEFNLKNLYAIDGYYDFILDDIIIDSKKRPLK